MEQPVGKNALTSLMGPSKPLATHPIITAAADFSDTSDTSGSDLEDDADVSSMCSASPPPCRGAAAWAATSPSLSPNGRVRLPAKFTKHGQRYHIHINIEPGCLGRVTAEVYFDIPPWEVFRIFTNPDNSDVFRDVAEVPERTLLQRAPGGLAQELLVNQVQCWRVLRQKHQGSTVLRVTEDARGADRLVQHFEMHTSTVLDKCSGTWVFEPWPNPCTTPTAAAAGTSTPSTDSLTTTISRSSSGSNAQEHSGDSETAAGAPAMAGFGDADWARAAGVSPVLLTGGTRAHLEHVAQPTSLPGMLKRVPLLKQLIKRLSMVRVARQLEDALAVADKMAAGQTLEEVLEAAAAKRRAKANKFKGSRSS